MAKLCQQRLLKCTNISLKSVSSAISANAAIAQNKTCSPCKRKHKNIYNSTDLSLHRQSGGGEGGGLNFNHNSGRRAVWHRDKYIRALQSVADDLWNILTWFNLHSKLFRQTDELFILSTDTKVPVPKRTHFCQQTAIADRQCSILNTSWTFVWNSVSFLGGTVV